MSKRLNPNAPCVCFKCRKSFKRDWSAERKPCPDCGGDTVRLDQKFKAPPKKDVKQWTIVEFLVGQGFYYSSIYDKDRPVPYPTTMDQAREFVRRYRAWSRKS